MFGHISMDKTVQPIYSVQYMYRDEIYSLQILLSKTQAGPGRTGKQEQLQTFRNHVQAFKPISV